MKKAFFNLKGTGHIMFESVSKRDKFAECGRKEKLTNVDALKIIQKIFKRDHKMMRSYLCPHCKMWHITHTHI